METSYPKYPRRFWTYDETRLVVTAAREGIMTQRQVATVLNRTPKSVERHIHRMKHNMLRQMTFVDIYNAFHHATDAKYRGWL